VGAAVSPPAQLVIALRSIPAFVVRQSSENDLEKKPKFRHNQHVRRKHSIGIG